MADLTYRVDISSSRALQGLRNIQGQVKKTDNEMRKLERSGNSFGASISNLKGIIAGVFTGVAIKGIVETTARFEDLETALSSTFGSAQKGQEAFRAIQALSTKTQFGIEELSETFIKLSGAGIQPTEDLLRTFTDTAAVTTDQLGSLQAITDLFSRTTAGGLGLEELNRLADRGIPVFDILNDKLGLSRLEISKFGQSAEGARTILDALTEGLDERFGGATAARLGNLSTLMSNFSIALKNAAGEIGATMGPALKDLIQNITDLITGNNNLAQNIGQVLGAMLNGLNFLLTQLTENFQLVASGAIGLGAVLGAQGLAGVLRRAAIAFKTLTIAMAKNPFGLIAVAVASLIAYLGFENGLGRTIVQVIAAFEVVGTALAKFGNFLKDKLAIVVDFVKEKFFNFVQSLIDTFNVIADLVPGIDRIESSSRELLGTVGELAEDGLEYAKGKANELAEAIKDAIPPEVLEQYDELKQAVAEAGIEYDKLNQKVEEGTPAPGEVAIPDISAGGITTDGTGGIKDNKKAVDDLAKSMDGLRNRLLPLRTAQANYNRDMATLNKALKEGLITTEEHAVAMANLNKEYQEFLDGQTEQQQTWLDGWKEAMDEYVAKARDSAAQAKELFNTATRGMEDAIVNFAKTGKLSFRSLLQDIAEQLLRSQIRQLMANVFGGASGGGRGGNFFSNLFGGFFATGGYIPAGRVGVVGEKGPEMVSGPASVTPMGGGGNVTYNINAVDVDSFRNLVASDPSFIYAVTEQGAREFRSTTV